MNSIISRGLDFILLSFVTAVLYFVHYNISMEYFLGYKIPLNAIYLFNYLSVLIFLIGSKLNLNYNFL